MKYNDIHQIMADDIFKEYLTLKNIGIATQVSLSSILLKYTTIQDMDLTSLINEADDEEEQNIRPKRRTIKKRLINFRQTLLEEGYANSTIKDYFAKVKTFYRAFEIEIPSITPMNLPLRQIDFDEIPNKNEILKVMKSTNNKKHRAIIIFQFSSCSAIAETLSITNQMFIDAVKEYTDETDINKVIPELVKIQKELKEDNNGIVPLFKLYRIKEAPHHEGGYKYYTCCTTECVDFILDYMEERISKKTIKNEDKLFDISTRGVLSFYARLNDKHGFPKIDNYRYFRSHNMRKAGNNAINNIGFADTISGRKRDDIHETYFLHDPKKIKEEYLEYIEDLTLEPTKIIYAAETTEEVKKLRKGRAKDQQRITDLENQVYRKREMLEDERSRNAERESKINEWFNDALRILLTYNIRPDIQQQLNLDLHLKDKINSNYNIIYNTPVPMQKLQDIVMEVYEQNTEKIQLLKEEIENQ